jgi:uncharacterized membrane protein
MQTKKQIHYLFIAGILFIISLVCFRVVFTESKAYLFLVWNLFLAYIPFFITYHLTVNGKNKKLEAVFCSAVWLLFLPNAAYLITDFLHLGQNNLFPKWFDIVVFFICILSGFGIYMGRYLRWNSWDIISNPIAIWQECFIRIIYPMQHLRAWGLTLSFAMLHLFGVYFLKIWSNPIHQKKSNLIG